MNEKIKAIFNTIFSNFSKIFTLLNDIFKLLLKVSSEIVFKLYNHIVVKLYNILEKIDSNIEKRLGKKFSFIRLALKITKWFVSVLYKFLYKLNVIFEEIIVEVDKSTNNSYSKPERELDNNSYTVDWKEIKNDDINFGISGGVYHQVNKDTYEFNMYFDEDNQPVINSDKFKDKDIKELRHIGKIYFCNNIINHIYNNKYTFRAVDQVGDKLNENDNIQHKVYERYRATFYEDNSTTVCLVEEYKRKEWKFIYLFELDNIKNESDINEFNIKFDDKFNIKNHYDDYINIIDDIIKNNIKDNKVDILDILNDIVANGISLITTIAILYAAIKSI